MSFTHIGALILAAGKGTRMHSPVPKVLQPLLNEPMLGYVFDAAVPVCGERVWTVVGHQEELLRKAFPGRQSTFVTQDKQLGTGHALQVAWPELKKAAITHVLVINGDTPLLNEAILRDFLFTVAETKADIAFITLTRIAPGRLGRVVRKNGRVAAIVEAKDFDVTLHGAETGEINAGIYCLDMKAVEDLLPELKNTNKSGEFYITDLIGLAVDRGLSVVGDDFGDDPQLLGINTPEELVRSEEFLRERIVTEHLQNGIFIRNPGQVRIGPRVTIARGVEITGPCEILGRSALAPGSSVAPFCCLYDVELAEGARVLSFSHLERACLGPGAGAGPYARLRPGAVLEQEAKVGNFVEVKKTVLRKKAKAGHLTYLGDADIGEGANIGAGTITCNYDGANKHRTVIGKGAFIGSNTALVAPVTIGENAVVGAGSTITQPVPENSLGIARQRQKNLPWKKKKD